MAFRATPHRLIGSHWLLCSPSWRQHSELPGGGQCDSGFVPASTRCNASVAEQVASHVAEVGQAQFGGTCPVAVLQCQHERTVLLLVLEAALG